MHVGSASGPVEDKNSPMTSILKVCPSALCRPPEVVYWSHRRKSEVPGKPPVLLNSTQLSAGSQVAGGTPPTWQLMSKVAAIAAGARADNRQGQSHHRDQVLHRVPANL
jgi:hypothetical protein